MTDTIFFDVGNTLRIVIPDKAFSDAAEKELMELVGATEPHDVFFEKLEKRWKKYRSEVKKTLIDAGEMELWSQHLLPDYDPERVCAHAGRLTRLWRDHDGRRVPRDDVKSTIIELDRRGYTLGIIANTITETEIPDWMIADGVAHYFNDMPPCKYSDTAPIIPSTMISHIHFISHVCQVYKDIPQILYS